MVLEAPLEVQHLHRWNSAMQILHGHKYSGSDAQIITYGGLQKSHPQQQACTTTNWKGCECTWTSSKFTFWSWMLLSYRRRCHARCRSLSQTEGWINFRIRLQRTQEKTSNHHLQIPYKAQFIGTRSPLQEHKTVQTLWHYEVSAVRCSRHTPV